MLIGWSGLKRYRPQKWKRISKTQETGVSRFCLDRTISGKCGTLFIQPRHYRQGDKMKKTLTLYLLVILFTINACASQGTAASEPCLLLSLLFLRRHRFQRCFANRCGPIREHEVIREQCVRVQLSISSNWFGPMNMCLVRSSSCYRVRRCVSVRNDARTTSEVKNSYSVVIQYSKTVRYQY